MECPKCHRESSSEKECTWCGIIFDKYRQFSRIEEKIPESISERSYPIPAWGIIAGVAVLAIIGYIIVSVALKPGNREEGDSASVNAAVNMSSTLSGSAAPYTGAVGRDSIRSKLEASFPPKNRIEEARNATVFVKTAWGVYGSGFFIDDHCHVVTNRHVIKVDQEDLARATQMRDSLKASIENDRSLLAKYRQRFDGNTNMQTLIAEKEKRVEAASEELDKFSAIIERAGINAPSDMNLILIDGTELPVQSVQLSEKYDLALLIGWCEDSPYLKAADLKGLAQGQKLYTIGNPEGMKFAVTSGIFSGWQHMDSVKVLQTDAPINPGNSGGPLITETGDVVGVNTAVLRSASNIGFALPIDAVFEEFSPYLKK